MSSRSDLITRAPYAVQVFHGQTDISETTGVRTIQYHADGSASQTRRDGSVQHGRWELRDDERVLRMTMEQSGVSDWTIIELSETLFRKHSAAHGLTAVQTPVAVPDEVEVA